MNNVKFFDFKYYWPSLKKVYERPHIARFAKEQAIQFNLDKCRSGSDLEELKVVLENLYRGYPSSIDMSDIRCENRKRADYYRYVLVAGCHYMMPVHLLGLQEWEPWAGWFGILGKKNTVVVCLIGKSSSSTLNIKCWIVSKAQPQIAVWTMASIVRSIHSTPDHPK
jgi:hypothetical protein